MLSGYPTTATEKDKYQLHLYWRAANSDPYILEYSGNYAPALNIAGSSNALATPTITKVDFAVLGPFTESFQFTPKRQPGSTGDFKTVVSTTITVSKTIHVSMGAGLIYISLRDPSNIREVPIAGSTDNTLIADDPIGRGVLTLMATFYPWGRNSLMMRSRRFKDHFGILVGTPISADKSNFKDLLAGVQCDFAYGGSIVVGAHFWKATKDTGNRL